MAEAAPSAVSHYDIEHEWLLAVAELEQLKRQTQRRQRETYTQLTMRNDRIIQLESEVKVREDKIRVLRSQIRTMEDIMSSMSSGDLDGVTTTTTTPVGGAEPEPFAMTVQDESRLRAVFDHVDKDGSGDINVREMIIGLRHDHDLCNMLHLPSHVRQEDGTRDAFERVFQEMDDDHTRVITFDQFRDHIAAWREEEEYAKKAGMEGKSNRGLSSSRRSSSGNSQVGELRLDDAKKLQQTLMLTPPQNRQPSPQQQRQQPKLADYEQIINISSSSPARDARDQSAVMSKMLGKVADLERQLNGERKAKENAEKKIAELLDAPGKTTTAEESGVANEQLQAELEGKTREANKIKEDLERLRAELERVQAQSELVQAELDRVQSESEQAQTMSERAEAESQRFQAELRTVREDAGSSGVRIQTLQDKLAGLQEELDQSQSDLELAAEQAVKVVAEAEEKAETAIGALKAELAHRQEDHARTVAQMKAHYEASANNGVSEVADQLLSARSEHASRVSSLRENLAGEQERCIGLKHRLKEAKKAENGLLAQLSDVTTAQTQQEAAWTAKLQDLEKMLAKAQLEALPTLGELAGVKSKLATSEGQLADAQAKLVRTEVELASTATQLEKVETKAARGGAAVAAVAEMTRRLHAVEEELALEKSTKMEFHKQVRARISDYKKKEKELGQKLVQMEHASEDETRAVAAKLNAAQLAKAELTSALGQTKEAKTSMIMRSMKATLRRWMHAQIRYGWRTWLHFLIHAREVESNKQRVETVHMQRMLSTANRKITEREEEVQDNERSVERVRERGSAKVAALEEEMERRREDHVRAITRLRHDVNTLHEELVVERANRRTGQSNAEMEERLHKEVGALRSKLFDAQSTISEMEIQAEMTRAAATRDLNAAQAERAQMETRLRNADASAKNLQRDVKSLQKHSRKSAMQMASLEKQLSRFREMAQKARAVQKEKHQASRSSLSSSADSFVCYMRPVTCSEDVLHSTLEMNGSGRLLKVAVVPAKAVAAVAFATKGGMRNIVAAAKDGTLRVAGKRVKVIQKA